MIYVDISFNKVFFVFDFLQWLKLCAQKTAVFEMDEISKFKFDLNPWLGTCHNALQYKNMNFSFKMEILVFFF